MKFLITGGNGFIGSHLTMRLLKEGHQVTVLDNFSTSPRNRLNNTGAKVIEGSVIDEKLVNNLVKEADYVLHLAAVVGVKLAMTKGIEGLKISSLGTDNILKYSTQYGKDILVTSSSAIYGKILTIPVKEDDDSLIGCSSKPSWLYSVSKLAEEHICLAYNREFGSKVKLCRLFNVIGQNQSKNYGMVVPNFVSKALKDEALKVYGDGTQTRTFAYIDDVIDGILLILSKGENGEIYNVGGTEEIRIVDLAEKIIKMTNSNAKIDFVPFQQVFGDNYEETMQRMPDITKIKKIGFSPKYSLDQSLEKIIYQIKIRGDI